MVNPNQRITLTLYPLWIRLLGRAVLYLALLLAPLIAVSWLGGTAPVSIRPAVQIGANVLLLPLLYVAQYWLLRYCGARSQNFIWLVVMTFVLVAVAELRKGQAAGGWEHGIGLIFSCLYAVGFAWLALWGWRRNQQEQLEWALADEQAQIDRQAAALVRAMQVEGHGDSSTTSSQHASGHRIKSADRVGGARHDV